MTVSGGNPKFLRTSYMEAPLNVRNASFKGWDRRRRCDLFDYDPPCGICEGYGGIPYGDENDQIDLSRCTPVAAADEVDPETLVRPVWGSRWTLPEAREILIGPKNDEFCFVVFPGDDSVKKQMERKLRSIPSSN